MGCRCCGRNKVNRPRGLCWTCYYTPGVKERYPSTSKYAHRGTGNYRGETPMPSSPTVAPPGSPEKIAILAERVRSRVSLWHPQDAGNVIQTSTLLLEREWTQSELVAGSVA